MEEIKKLLIDEAINIEEEDLRTCMEIGENGRN